MAAARQHQDDASIALGVSAILMQGARGRAAARPMPPVPCPIHPLVAGTGGMTPCCSFPNLHVMQPDFALRLTVSCDPCPVIAAPLHRHDAA
jgi:hypothetical protein